MKRSLVALVLVSALGCAHETPAVQGGLGGNTQAPQIRQGNPQNGWAVFPLPGSNAIPQGIVAGPDGGMWYVETRGDSVDRFDVSAGTVKRHPITASATPTFITVGSDGALWFNEFNAGKIGRMTTHGALTEYAIPDGSTAAGTMALGADGDIWFNEFGFTSIGAVSPTGTFRTYRMPDGHQPYDLTAGPDGNVWFTELAGRVGKITPSGVITEYFVGGTPLGIVSRGGVVWYTDNSLNRLDKITTDGRVKEYPLPITHPTYLAEGPRHFLWFINDDDAAKLAEFDPRTHATIVRGTAPGTCCFYQFLATGPDGNIYVTASETNEMVVRVLDVLKTSPSSLSIAVGGSQTFSITEKVYHGLWGAVSSNTNVATVSQSSPGVFSVIGVAPGSAKITVSDTIGNSIDEQVSVH